MNAADDSRFAALEAQHRALTEAHERLRRDVRKARNYAGDNLPAAVGLTLVALLENALNTHRKEK